MDDNEKESVDKLLNLAKLSLICMMIIGGFMGQSTIVGLI